MSGSARAIAVLLALSLLPTWAFVDVEVFASSHARTSTTWDSVYSAEQATRGQATYTKTCQRCHTATLGGADESPALTGGAFLSNWNGQTLYTLHDRIISSMPSDTPGVYKKPDVADVIAYILSVNGYPAGKNSLPMSDDSLKSITISTSKP